MSLSAIEKIIYQRTGLTFDAHRTTVLKDKVARHMAVLDLDSVGDYYKYLCTDQAVFNALVDELTINESYFFREPAHLDLLCHAMVPMFAHEKKIKRFSILSAGCATGEEPCSIAMALEQTHGSSFLSTVRIMGLDIDNTALLTARSGIYGKWKLRQLSCELKSLYFKHISKKKYAIRPDILEKIEYHRTNLVKGPLPEIIGTVDVIFYRNVSIYFDESTRAKVLMHLERALNPGGFLVLGSAETLSHDTGTLCLVEINGCFVYQKKSDKSCSHEGMGPVESARHLRPGFRKREKPRVPWCTTGIHGHFSNKGNLSDIATGKKGKLRLGVHESLGKTNGKTDDLPPKGIDEKFLKNSEMTYKKALALARQKQFDAALSLLSTIVETKEDTRDDFMEKIFILRAGILMQQGDGDGAKKLCRHLIGQNIIYSPAYLLLGMIEGMENNPLKSLSRLRETTYIQPDNWLAHFLMFQAFRNLGREKEASRQATIVVRLLEKQNLVHHGLDYFPLSFSRKQILELCRQHALLTT
ncbi:chemotaxis protein methyltransferase CheR [Desulfocicer vacuolatum DSM 3385]|uniref:protein-glutamate O-methyltransferase n=1 Tax=Desulfocicer vacuolatum DSM 3385 TaxID=1121400 RepID=A0A1W2AKC8_9BACT|nr:protein-glutamate O-methyltransferase CheR [Desulfocicer vacuolatum]SMC61093.1 chemotaxis protein methyltransferase CheR [Desulfocicer vacuolatum DSM 3385]